MAGITTTTVDDLIQAALAESRAFIDTNAILANTITRYNISDKHIVDVPVWGSCTVYDVTEGTDLSSTNNLSTSKVTLTGSKKAVRDYITDQARAGAGEDLGFALGKRMGEAITAKINQDIFGLFDGFSKQVIAVDGTGTTDNITITAIKAAKGHLVKAGAVKSGSEVFLAVTPHVYEDVLNLFSDVTAAAYRVSDVLANEASIRGELEKVYGCQIVVVGDLASGTSTGQRDAAQIKCGMYTREALAINVYAPFNIEKQRDASMIGDEYVGSIGYAVGEIKDSYGVEILCVNNDD